MKLTVTQFHLYSSIHHTLVSRRNLGSGGEFPSAVTTSSKIKLSRTFMQNLTLQ